MLETNGTIAELAAPSSDEFDLDVSFSSSLWVSTEISPKVVFQLTDTFDCYPPSSNCTTSCGGSSTAYNKTL
jgi:hypothetical protein